MGDDEAAPDAAANDSGKERDRRAKLAERVRIARIRAGFSSQEEVAKKAGVNVKTVGELENGRGNITTRHLWRIADVLGVSASELLGDADR